MNRRLQTLLKLSVASRLPVLRQKIQLADSLLQKISVNVGFVLDSVIESISINNGAYPELALARVSKIIPGRANDDTLSSIPGWDGILMAVPKRKTTPSKKKNEKST
mmetsp:Transcript_2813/g.3798  ORF Transcript_2813/g.3798 Transcript_2813/m.3798 type:complete len:107 (-) Transcript_2813:362-682(-)